MQALTRRDFTVLLITSVVPLGRPDSLTSVQEGRILPGMPIPDSIGGRSLTAREKELTTKFLTRHEQDFAPLRRMDFPNSLAPALSYTSELSSPR